MHLVHPALEAAWAINRNLEMCFIFDAVSPARLFKHGMVYDEEAHFPEFAKGNWTEIDGPSPGWMPVSPLITRCVMEILYTLPKG